MGLSKPKPEPAKDRGYFPINSRLKILPDIDLGNSVGPVDSDYPRRLIEEIFKLEDLQLLQDQFAAATGVASLITLPDGTPLTSPSNFCDLCSKLIRTTPLGRENCRRSDAIIGGQNINGPVIARCLSGGIWDSGASITLGGVHIANWLVGQVRYNDPPEESLRAYAHEIGVDEDAFMEAYDRIPQMSEQRFLQVSEFLFSMAKQLSEQAFQNAHSAKIIKEKEAVEKQLKASEEKYKSYIENAPTGLLIIDDSGFIQDVNPAVCRMSQFEPDELMGMFFLEAVFEEDKNLVLEWLQENPGFEPGSTIELRMFRKDGSISWVAFNGTRLSNSLWIVYCNEINIRKQAEIELKRKSDDLEMFFNSALDLLCIADLQGIFLKLNPEWENALGYAQGELIGTNFLELVHPDDHQSTMDAISRLSENYPVLNFTNRYRHKNGSFKWIEWRSIPIGNLIYASARDITSRIELEQKEKQNLEKFHAVFGSMVEGCALHEVILNEKGEAINYRLIDVNPAYERILGLSAAEIRGKLGTEVYQTSDPPYLKEFTKVGLSGIPYRMTTYFPPMEKYFEISISSPGKNQFATIFSDITKQVRNEEEITRLNQNLEQKVKDRTLELESANKELEAFTYSVSHDLRAPLRSIDGFSQILLEDCAPNLSEDGIHYLNRVRSATQQMGQLIDDLLRLSRIMRIEMNISRVNLSEMARIILQNLEEENPTRKARYSIMPDMGVDVDSGLLSIALENLIRNAWKFSSNKDETFIEIGYEMVEQHQVYFIRDHGAGFDMAYASKLFGAFQRLHSPDEFEGTGIGLAIVQRIIHRHNGTIWADGVPGEGATFRFTLQYGG
jgi:PAS domain S-box-containing protein